MKNHKHYITPILIFALFCLCLSGCAQPQVFYAFPKAIGIKGEKILVYTDGPPYWFSKSRGATFDGYVTSGFRMATFYESVDRTIFVKAAVKSGLNINSEMREKISGLEISYLYISDKELPKLFDLASAMGIAFLVKTRLINYSETIGWEKTTLTHRSNIVADFTVYDVKKRRKMFQKVLTANGIYWDFDAKKNMLSFSSTGKKKRVGCDCSASVDAITGLVRQMTRLIKESRKEG
jgi:hypothetical protein